MSAIEAISLVITAIVVPYVVALIRNRSISGAGARWLAIAVSVAAGAVAALVGGVPADPGAWVTCIFAAIGAVQVAYAAFRSVGVTSGALDALMGLGKGAEDPDTLKKYQAMEDKAEEVSRGN